MGYTDKFTELDFIEFKQHLITIAKEEFFACDTFGQYIDNVKSPNDLKYVLQHYANEIYEKLTGEDIDDLKEKISELENQLEAIEDTVEDHTELFPTLHDEMKYEIFLKLHKKYNPWEFENLLLNGK